MAPSIMMTTRLRPALSACAQMRMASSSSSPSHLQGGGNGSPGGSKGSMRVYGLGAALAALGSSYYAYNWYNNDSCSLTTTTSSKKMENQSQLSPDEFRTFKLHSIQKLNHNVSVFRFELPDASKPAGLPNTSFVVTRFKDAKGQEVTRPYTPTSLADEKGYFDLLVKHYKDGAMSSHIFGLKNGDLLEIKGPISKYPIKTNMHDSITMIAGGTGITPMYQIINHVLRDPNDKTPMTLIFANISENDIILKKELDELAKKNAGRLKIHYVLDKPASPSTWSGHTGHINLDLLKKLAPAPAPGGNTKVFVCGPPGMVSAICGPKAPDYSQGELDGVLKALSYTKDQVFKF